jgi:hypothetical protein
MTERLFFDENEAQKLGMSLSMASAIGAVVSRNMDDYVTLSYAGDPNGNIAANFSFLCIDTTNDFLYYNLTVGGTTWTKVVV